MSRAHKTWDDEEAYISMVALISDFSSFNNDAACFVRYCEMQARGARKDGRDDVADAIEQIACDIGGAK